MRKMTGKQKREIIKTLGLITQIGLGMMVSLAISLYLGYWLDRLCGTKFIIIIMLFIGIGAAIKSMLIVTHDYYGEDKRKDKDGEK